ncbi:hypothetical protein AM231_08850 [Paenibacillus solani]|uniref:ROK family transcriptional regulator n=2 Tax=Paenibacillus solani TaxID=1705565 RepID=A0A0M1P873_9BACL|nr:hypothetical protein AM231_08850 [Paenibacillus solani]
MLKQFTQPMSPKNLNLQTMYRIIHKFGPVSVSDVVELSKLKPNTCARLLEELMQANLIQLSGYGLSSGGRKPLMYRINPEAYSVIGVDISLSYITIALLDLELNIVDVSKKKFHSSESAEAIQAFCVESVQRLILEHHIDQEKLLGIGLGSTNLRPVNGIVQLLEERFKVRVIEKNGADLAALGEYRKFNPDRGERLIYTMCSISIRSGLVTNLGIENRLSVLSDRAFGHMVVDVNGPRCSCGSYGCLEALSSIQAIRHELIRLIRLGQPSKLTELVDNIEYFEFEHLQEALTLEDPLTCQVVRTAAYYFGVGLFNLILITQPDTVIIGGALGPNPVFFNTAVDAVTKRMTNMPEMNIQYKPAANYNIVAIGAGCHIIDSFTE